MARYGQTFKDKAVARLLPPEGAAVEVIAREVGIGAGLLPVDVKVVAAKKFDAQAASRDG